MSDTADKTLKLRIELDGYVMPGAKEAEDKLAEANANLAKEMGVVTVTQEDVEKATKKTSEATEEAGKKTEEAGHHAANARLQHMALHHAFTELNKIAPGLGDSLNMITRGMHSMGEGAEGAQSKIADRYHRAVDCGHAFNPARHQSLGGIREKTG